MKLPVLLTRHGSTANPFADVATCDSEAAMLLAIAVVTAHDNDEIYPALRAMCRLLGRSPTGVSGYLSGRYMTDADGDTCDRDLLNLYAHAFLGDEPDSKMIQWTAERFPGALQLFSELDSTWAAWPMRGAL